MKIKRTLIILIIIFLIMFGIGCTELTGYTIDVGFRDGNYKQYDYVKDWIVVEEGIISDTVDLHFTNGNTIRLHYVTSVEIIEQNKIARKYKTWEIKEGESLNVVFYCESLTILIIILLYKVLYFLYKNSEKMEKMT